MISQKKYQIYETTIIKLYKRAISTNTIEYQFLSFYQILEYLFDRILIEKRVDDMKFLVAQVQQEWGGSNWEIHLCADKKNNEYIYCEEVGKYKMKFLLKN